MRAVAVYPAGVVCSRFYRRVAGPRGGGRRGVIRCFSPASRRRLRSCVLSSVDPSAVSERRVLWITLTIRQGTASELKRFLRASIQRLRYSRIGFSLIWRLEYQRRGTPHIHIILISHSTAAALAAAKVLVANFLRLSGAGVSAQCVKFVRNLSSLAIYITDMSKVDQSNPGSDHPGRWWGRCGDFLVIRPILIYGADYYFQCLRFFRSLRRSRLRRRGRRLRSRSGLSSEFFDTAHFVPYLQDICGA